MNETFRLGTIAGVRVGVHWSVLVIATLLLAGLASGQFPLLYPGYSGAAYVAAGVIAAAIFFSSLLAHEMAHALVARAHGVEVEGITLWMFGGVAKLLGESPDPRADLRIAGVGPLVSFVLGAVFATLTMLGAAIGVDRLVLGVVGWLALINLVLAVFNLIPAAPLDGGRILRGVLWRRHGDRFRAAATAARAGRAFGYLLVALGLTSMIVWQGIGGLWFVLIGWFISSAASGEEQYARVQDALQDVLVARVMTPNPLTVPAGISVAELLDDHVLRARCSTFPMVDDDGRLLGLVTLNRIKPVATDQRASVPIDAVASAADDVVQVAPGDRIIDMIAPMTRSTDGRAVVVDDGRVVGIVSPTDIARVLELLDVTRGQAGIEPRR